MFDTSKPIYIGIAIFITLAFLVSLLLYRQSINILIALLPGTIAAATFGVLAWRLGLRNQQLTQAVQEKEEALLRLQKTSDRSLKHLSRLFHFTAAMNEIVVHATEVSSLYKDVCAMACKIGNFRLAAIWLGEPEHQVVAIARSHESSFPAKPDDDSALMAEASAGPIAKVIRSGGIVKSDNVSNEVALGAWAQLAAESGYHSATFLPVRKHGKTIGCLSLYSADSFAFDDAEVQMLVEATNGLSFALEHLSPEKRPMTLESNTGAAYEAGRRQPDSSLRDPQGR